MDNVTIEILARQHEERLRHRALSGQHAHGPVTLRSLARRVHQIARTVDVTDL